MSIILQCDDQSFEVKIEGAQKSSYLQNLIESGQTTIAFHDLQPEVLEKVAEYLNYYADKDFPSLPETLESNDLKSQIDEWDFSFIESISYEDCFHLINAGILLKLNHLYDLACSRIAAFIRGKTPEEINQEFIFECQFTQDEAKQLGLEPN